MPEPVNKQPDAAVPQLARRDFLKAMPVAAVAAVVAGAAPEAVAAPAVAAAPAATASLGYRETEHIRRYYQTAAYW
jgi:anaerobic selenocysteine-containing dehydrogenase